MFADFHNRRGLVTRLPGSSFGASNRVSARRRVEAGSLRQTLEKKSASNFADPVNKPRLLWLVLLTLAFSCRAAEDSRRVLEMLFQPGGITHMALSPDGRSLAYTVSGLQTLTLGIVDVETGRIRATLPLEDPKIRPRKPPIFVVVPATVFLQWANARQLVYAGRHHADAFESHGDVRMVDADGKNDRLLFNEEHAGYRMLQGVVGFAADQPDKLVADLLVTLP